jgi:hypothetical protein
MHLAVSQKPDPPKTRKCAKKIMLKLKGESRLTADQIVAVSCEVFLPKLDHRIGALASRVSQPDWPEGTKCQHVFPTARHLLER